MKTIYLVSCVKSKRDKKSPARDLYTSLLFKKAREISETFCDEWFILSAKHGLVEPDRLVEPYELTLNKMKKSRIESWANSTYKQLVKKLDGVNKIIFLTGSRYRENLIKIIRQNHPDIKISTPTKNLSLGNQLSFYNRVIDYIEFTNLIEKLEKNLDGLQSFSNFENLDLPNKGIYFFFDGGDRLTRIGTHGVSKGSKPTLLQRLRAHKGTKNGLGNHRASVFRLHIGQCLITKNKWENKYPNWGRGQNATKEIKESEISLEQLVSKYINDLKILWLDIDDESNKNSDRGYTERNSIALISGVVDILEKPKNWLGKYSSRPEIASSFLWNVNHVGENHDRKFLAKLKKYVN